MGGQKITRRQKDISRLTRERKEQLAGKISVQKGKSMPRPGHK